MFFGLGMGLNAQTRKAGTTQRKATSRVQKNKRVKYKAPTAQEIARRRFPFQISGEVDGLKDSGYVFMGRLSEKGLQKMDSAKVSGGKFFFKGSCGLIPSMRFLFTGRRETFTCADFFMEPGKLTARIKMGEPAEKINGTMLNDIFTQYKDTANPKNVEVFRQQAVLRNRREKNSVAEAQARVDSLKLDLNDFTYRFASRNMNNMVGLYLLDRYYQDMTVAQDTLLLASIEPPLDKLSSLSFVRDYVARQKITLLGRRIPAFASSSSDGSGAFSLSAYSADKKVILLHFWDKGTTPSWVMVPYILKCYQKYQNKGFGAVSVYMGQDKQVWDKSVNDFRMIWPQVSDLQGMNGAIRKAFGFDQLPFTLLVDAEGKILERQIKSEDFETVIQKYIPE